MSIKSWETCPVCQGLGTVPPPPGLTNVSMEQCSVCYGKKIISTLTGLPPGYDPAAAIGKDTNSTRDHSISDNRVFYF